MTTKSCLNCLHCNSWYEPQTYWEPSDSGWECKLELDCGDVPSSMDDMQMGEYFAAKCGKFEQKPLEKDPPDEFIEQDPELELLSNCLRLQSLGLLDKDFLPTDAFFECV